MNLAYLVVGAILGFILLQHPLGSLLGAIVGLLFYISNKLDDLISKRNINIKNQNEPIK